jgi:hypothetical protein
VNEVQPENRPVPASVRLSLISHTNVGKTTLARTLLRRDIGEVRDAAHVTEVAERHALIETPQGDELVLWDTPGFGDSARLLRRLEQSGNPLGWFLTQVWDRYTDRPFWSSQQAARNVRDHADVVLYLVNAGEDPVAAGYVDPEMRILGWIGKPVLVLLNQLGPPQRADAEAADVGAWTQHLASHAVVRRVLALDAFARCWVQEYGLLDAVAAILPPAAQPSFGRIAAAWRDRNLATFEASIAVLARQLAVAATDTERVAERGLAASARDWLNQLAAGERTDPALERAMTSLAARLDREVRATTDELIALHGLSGRAAAEILERMGHDVDVDRAADPDRASLLGAAVTGALGGLAADLAAGGLTFGAGALIGGVLGAAGMLGLARAYNLARGSDSTTVRWSAQFLAGRVTAAAMRYLAVAHFGRGRGDYVQSEYPAHWHGIVATAVAARRGTLDAIWSAAAAAAPPDELAARLKPLMDDLLRGCLVTLYPEARGMLSGRLGPADELRLGAQGG